MAFKKSLVYILLIVAAAFNVQAKPSLPHFEYPFFADHVNFAPPVLPPPHFHAPTAFAAPAPAPVLPAPVQFLPAPAPLLPAHPPLLPAPAPLVPAPVHIAPAPLPLHLHPLPAPVVHAPFAPAPAPVTRVLPPFFEPVPFVAPSYRAIPGPKTTTHHVSVGYAFPPAPTFAKFSHHHHHNSLF